MKPTVTYNPFDNTENCIDLRDYFAGQVIAGLAADPNYRLDEDGADMAYKVADMMMKRREK